MSINHVTVSGNLTRDPEVRTTWSGNPVMSLGIAVNDRRRKGTTELEQGKTALASKRNSGVPGCVVWAMELDEQDHRLIYGRWHIDDRLQHVVLEA